LEIVQFGPRKLFLVYHTLWRTCLVLSCLWVCLYRTLPMGLPWAWFIVRFLRVWFWEIFPDIAWCEFGTPNVVPCFVIAASHVDFTGWPHTACIHLIACSVEGRSYTLLAWCSMRLAFLVGLRSCKLPHCWTRDMWYRPLLSCAPISIGLPLHMMRTLFSLCTTTPSFVKMEIVPASAVLPTLIRECGNSLDISANQWRYYWDWESVIVWSCCQDWCHHWLPRPVW